MIGSLPKYFQPVVDALQKTLPMAQIEISTLPKLPSLRLGLINSNFQTGPLPAEVMHAVTANPAYWAFCWGSGLATAQWLLHHPQLVAGKQVADLGCGSGVVAIAARLAGAAEVFACDIDANAIMATQANARLNQAQVKLCRDLDELPTTLDVLFMADVLYDRSNFELVVQAKGRTKQLIIADSRVVDVKDSDFCVIHQSNALTFPNLGEFDEFNQVKFFAYTAKTLVSAL